MSKVVITIEDTPDGKVKTVVEPSCETLIQKVASGSEMTSAEAYALFVVRHLREESKRQSKTPIHIPRVGKA